MFGIIKAQKRSYSKVFLIETRNNFLKIPYSLGSWKTLRAESVLMEEARKDICFCDYLPEYKYILGGLGVISEKLSPLEKVETKDSLVREYFKKAFEGVGQWKKGPLKQLLNAGFFLDFVSKEIPRLRGCFLKYLEQTQLPESSAHGDFHEKNILVKNGQLYFIDWSYYKKTYSRYFDLLDFYIFTKGREGESWIRVWRRENERIPGSVFGIELPEGYFLAYAVWRISQEIERFYRDKYKRRKYADFLAEIAGLINKFQSRPIELNLPADFTLNS